MQHNDEIGDHTDDETIASDDGVVSQPAATAAATAAGAISCNVERLNDYLLELVFTHIDPYLDFANARAVSRRWWRVGGTAASRMRRLYHRCANFAWHSVGAGNGGGGGGDSVVANPVLMAGRHLLSERCSHAACYHPGERAMYVFGGCTSTYTAFNDLWRFDLVSVCLGCCGPTVGNYSYPI